MATKGKSNKKIKTDPEKLLSRVLFVLNIIYLGASIYLVVQGIRTYSKIDRNLTLLHKYSCHEKKNCKVSYGIPPRMPTYILMVHSLAISMGLLVYFVAVLGLGLESLTGWEHKAYLVLLYLVALLTCVTGVLGFAMRWKLYFNDLGETWYANLKELMEKFLLEGQYDVTKFWTIIQRDVMCCGVTSYTDWLDLEWYQTQSVPGCCCKGSGDIRTAPGAKCGARMANATSEEAEKKIYIEGCVPAIEKHMLRQSDIYSGINLGLTFVTLVALFLTCALKNMKKTADRLKSNQNSNK